MSYRWAGRPRPVAVVNRDTRLDRVETAILELEELGKALPDEYDDLRDAVELNTAELIMLLGKARERSERDG